MDDTLFYSIASDYELPTDQHALITVLDGLRADAIAQESSDFDPSGTGGSSVVIEPQSTSSRNSPEDTATSNDVTSIATGLTELNLREVGCVEKALESLPHNKKHEWLKNLFPSLGDSHIQSVLEGSTSLEQAVEELLNFAFLEEDSKEFENSKHHAPKGIDGFAEEFRPQQRKGRGKKKTRTTDMSRTSSTGSYGSDSQVSPNVWSTAAEDVEFICARTNLQPHTVKSVYHANGARLSSTIKAFADKEGASWAKLDKTDSILQMQIAEVKTDLDFVLDSQVYGLLTLARNMPSAARELLEAMTAIPEPETVGGKLHGFAQYTPPNLTSEDDHYQSKSSDSWTAITNGTNIHHLAVAHSMKATQSFSQASSAFRKSKSDKHMGGAAAYYASVGHENFKAAKSLNAAAANAHVAAQSSGTTLDLHGVSVADATRIARERTHMWWEGLGDAKYAPGGCGAARADFKIVTGLGSHSKNHAPRIGPAVAKMLVREGWRVEVGQGELWVTGKARR